MPAPEAEALIATGSSARCSLCDAFDVERITKRGNLQRRTQADKQWADFWVFGLYVCSLL